MSPSINTNLASLIAQRSTMRSQGDLAASIARLSSGLRVNGAKDDAAGLAIADRMTSQTRGLAQAGRNANDAISLAQTADGALSSVGDNLQRIRELAVQAANATNSPSDRAALQLEAAQLVAEIDRVATQTQFNGTNLLDGSFTARAFQVGANVGQTVTVSALANSRSSTLGVYQGFARVATIGASPSSFAQTLTVNVGGAGAISLGTVAVDAKAIADAINNGSIRGLTASANPTLVTAGVSTANASTAGTGILTVNGLAINIAGVNGAAALAGNRAAAVSAINAQSAATGVTATDTGSGVSLNAADGRNILASYAAGSFTGSSLSGTDFGMNLWASTGGATVNLLYSAPPGVVGNVVFAQTMGFSNTTAIAASGTPLAAVDVSTVAGATAALASVDFALATVNSNRASLGAVENRFASAIANAQATSQNAAASRSRIQDADFAEETANLSRAQVLQQAGTAMVAQANQLPRQVLELLR